MSNITTLLFDVGGVILTNGWSHELREKAAQHFDYNYDTVEERHQRFATPFECGKLNLDDYLSQTVFACLFIDDREENAEAAQQCGINAVHLPRSEDLEKVLRGEGIEF